MALYSAKFDAYSAVWKNSCLDTVCNWYGFLDVMDGFYDDVIPKFTAYVYGTYANITFNDILISVPSYEFGLVKSEDRDIRTFEFSYIRVQMMGQALEFLRDLGIDVDGETSVLRKFNENCNPTRVDFAFDFVNYCTSIDNDIFVKFDNFTKNSTRNLSESGRLCIHGHKSGIGYTKRIGSSERTIYIGSPTSDRLLRIYDKYLERKSANNGVFADTSFGNPADVFDWTRIEWQLRNESALKYLYAPKFTFMGVLNEIYSFYNIYAKSNGNKFTSWLDWWAPENLEKYLVLYEQKTNFVSKREKLHRYIKRQIPSLIAYAADVGLDQLIKEIQDYLTQIQTPNAMEELEEKRLTELYKLTKRLCEISENNELSGLQHITNENGILKFK